ncbi:MAG: adenine nucleotide alpha hydrolase family protein, partial [Candidatus Korarchaeota archaeon]|nr:adenine nucleotide alpha hydrolase family protein [Candidatus Korarchaeota archaeon]
ENYEELGIPYRLVDLGREYGFTMDQVASLGRRLGRPVCSACGIVKRYVLNRVAYEEGLDAVATGHNLDDMWELAVRSLASGGGEELGRLDLSSPPGPRLVRRIKPLGLTEEWLVEAYAGAKNLRFFEGTCPYKPLGGLREAIREAGLFMDEEAPGYTRMLVAGMLKAPRGEKPTRELRFCERCGMPTTRRICAFCGLRDLVAAHRGG